MGGGLVAIGGEFHAMSGLSSNMQGVAGSNPVTPTNVCVSDSISYTQKPETPSPVFLCLVVFVPTIVPTNLKARTLAFPAEEFL